MPGDFDPFGKLAEAMRYERQMRMQERSADMADRMAMAQLAQLERQNQQEMARRNAFAQAFAPEQSGGPLMYGPGEAYQPVDFTYQEPTREELYQTFGRMGDVEMAQKFAPQISTPEYDIKETEGGYAYFPKTPGKVVQTGVMGRTRQPLVSIQQGEEKEEAKAVGRGAGQEFIDIQTAGKEAVASNAKYDRLGKLLETAGTGKFRGATKTIAEAARSIGINVDPNLEAAQAAESISNQLALELRNPAGGAGMPGAMSDKDREFLVRMVPSLTQTPGGIKLLIDYKKKLNERSKEVARMAREYRRKRGSFDYGFYDELAEWSGRNQMFETMSGREAGMEVNGIKFLGFE